MSFGASLEEVWGVNMDLPLGSVTKPAAKKQRPTDDEACQIYASAKKIDDIINYVQSKGESYEKTPTSRSQMPLPETDGADRGQGEIIAKNIVDLPAERRMIFEGFQNQNRERDYLDFALYVFSGVVLIFVLEQFIQIGINLQRKL
jgi:hypothetical protein